MSLSLKVRPALIISSSFSSTRVISFPPGGHFPQRHPPQVGSQAALMLSHFSHSRTSLLHAAVIRTSILHPRSKWLPGLPTKCSSTLTATILMECAKCVSDCHVVTSTSSKRLGCTPLTVLPRGPSHNTRSPTRCSLCGANRPSRALIKRSIFPGRASSPGSASGKNCSSRSELTTRSILAMSSIP